MEVFGGGGVFRGTTICRILACKRDGGGGFWCGSRLERKKDRDSELLKMKNDMDKLGFGFIRYILV